MGVERANGYRNCEWISHITFLETLSVVISVERTSNGMSTCGSLAMHICPEYCFLDDPDATLSADVS